MNTSKPTGQSTVTHLLLEGVDGAGKSTLAGALSQTTGWSVVRKTVADLATARDFHLFYHGYAIGLTDLFRQAESCASLIFDRSFVSDWVYSVGIVGADRAAWDDWEQAVSVASGVRTVGVWVNTSHEELARRLRTRPDRFTSLDQIADRIARYDSYVRSSRLEWIVLNGDLEVGDNVANVVCYLNSGDF